jgi:hypothetical protein
MSSKKRKISVRSKRIIETVKLKSSKKLSNDKKLDLILKKLENIEKSQKTIEKDENELISEENSMLNLERKEISEESTIERKEDEEIDELKKIEALENNIKQGLKDSPLKRITYRDVTKGIIGAFFGIVGHFAFVEGTQCFL